MLVRSVVWCSVVFGQWCSDERCGVVFGGVTSVV